VSLRAQEAFLYRGGYRTAWSRISSGREGYRTPVGRFQVIRKDENRPSSIYGDCVDDSGEGQCGCEAGRQTAAFSLRGRTDALLSRVLARVRVAPGLSAGSARITWMH
jgi:hypothetical protein